MKLGRSGRERSGASAVIAVVVGLVLLVGGGYVAAVKYSEDRVPRGTRIAGFDIGGLSRNDAVAALSSHFTDQLSEPINVSVDGNESSVDPVTLGVTFDPRASVDAAMSDSSWSPGSVWEFFVGGNDVDAAVTVSDDDFTAALDELQANLGTPPRNGVVRFVNGTIRTTEPKVGLGINPSHAREALIDAWFSGDTAQLDIVDLAPDIDDDDVRTAVDTFANPALSGPITLTLGSQKVRLRPAQYVDALSLKAEGGVLVPQVAPDALDKLVGSAVSDAVAPQDATVRLVRGKPRVVPAQPGLTFEADDVRAAFLEAVAGADGERAVEVEGSQTPAEFTTEDARALGIKEKVSEFVTYYPPTDYRNINIGRAAELIDGTVLKPGDVFSLNGIVGERTIENGFVSGGVISGGVFSTDIGGGVSQMATTTFNAMFFAGLEDIEHKPHSLYISRYPEGREATVNWGTLDLKFRNDTDYGVLVHSYVVPSTATAQGEVHVEMYSTKVWDIGSRTSERYAYSSPGTVRLTTPDCTPQTGTSGFQVDVTRVFRKHGEKKIDHTEDFHTVYNAGPTVLCGPPPKETPDPDGPAQ